MERKEEVQHLGQRRSWARGLAALDEEEALHGLDGGRLRDTRTREVSLVFTLGSFKRWFK